MSIKIVIADDHALLRQGIKRVLNFEEDLEVIGEAEDGQEALARTKMLQPDILLLDLNMPGMSGLEVARQLKAAQCPTKIIALTIHDGDNYVLELLKNGALGYLLKDVEPATLVRAIHIVNEGKPFIYPSIAERVFGSVHPEGDLAQKAREIQLKYLDLINALFIEVNPIPIKEAMNLRGMEVGGYRLPLCEMDPANKAKLIEAMKVLEA